jgi:hypothetical protein
MLNWLNKILMDARGNFTRASAHQWFVIIVLGLMIGQERIGVTSIIRELWLSPQHYAAVLHFFRSAAWKLASLRGWWIKAVLESGVLHQENGMPVMVGDGTKKSKEGRKMPCVKKLRQESENSAKPAYIFGHMFGMVGVLAGSIGKLFCIPLSIKIHDGDYPILRWDAKAEAQPEPAHESHVVRMIRDASQCARQLGKSILLLDAYYLSVPALAALSAEAKTAGRDLLSIVVRAKKNAAAYRQPVRKPGRGRPPLKGESVKLMEWFKHSQDALTTTAVMLYGKEETVSFLSCDLLWGQKHYQLLRFVVAQTAGGNTIILASNDLTLTPVQIIRLYSYRFKVECAFAQLKHTLAGFAYRFWSTAMQKLNKYAPKGTEPLEAVEDENDKNLISAAFRATQGYVTVSSVALGLLQICALRFADEINASPLRWLRTRTNLIPSEATTADFMRKTIFKCFASNANLSIIRFILQLQINDLASDNLAGA